ncbi:hypothetical protein COCON_G00154130 [Conger conger]|uniref:Aminopeptidase N-like N-terminal domain-containing protein n=1 Tax=Conger conger TaxID=82655 RepID=A0A9Q1D8X5_CONCO|nr:hypothetical protein COCON_G00154130 [Conger conger]
MARKGPMPRSTASCLCVLTAFLFSSSVLSAAATEQSDGENKTPSPRATNGQPFPWDKMRLPETVWPLHYDLFIHPNLTTLDFTGTVQIQLEVLQDTSVIILHSRDLRISKAALLESSRILPLQVLENPEFQQVALQADGVTFTQGSKCAVYLEFAANLSESFHGFYKSTYRTSQGEVRVVASTQFEATSARAALPCFDEPAFKANFSVRIRREARHISLSNMPKVKTVELSSGLLDDYFDMSVKMSTYLLAFIVSDFLSISKMSQHGVKCSYLEERGGSWRSLQ